MKEVLSELNEGNSVLLELEKLAEFLDYSLQQDDYYAYRLEYFENHVKIKITSKEIIIKLKSE